MKRIYIALALFVVGIITGAVEVYDISARVDNRLNELEIIDKNVKQSEYKRAYDICERMDREFIENTSDIVYCYYRHDDLEKINCKLAVMGEYIKQRDKTNYLATSKEVIKMLTILKAREQLSFRNIL